MTATVDAAAVDTGERRRPWVLFSALAVALLLAELDSTIFASALPTVVGELDGVRDMLWVNTAYGLCGTIVLPVVGHLSDRVGRKPLLVAALTVFLAGSVLGGLATDMPTLVAARGVQGLGGGGLLILVQAVVADVIPARDRAPYLSAIGAVFAGSAVAGPVVGGWLTEGIGWRWAFWLNLPLGGAAILAVLVLLREPPRERNRNPLDVGGFAALTVGVTAVVLLASWGGTAYAWRSPVVLGLVVTVVVSVLVFIRVERRAVEPMMPMSLFADRTFTTAVVAGLLMAVAMFGTVGYLPTYLQMVSGLGPTAAGMAMLTLIAGLALCTVGSAQLVRRTGRYRALTLSGTLLTAAALALLATLTPATPLWLMGVYLFLLGAGIGCAWEVLVVVVQNASPDDRVGTATATNSFFREIGVCLGSAVVGALFAAQLRLPAGAEALTPEQARALPLDLRLSVAQAYNDALTPVFALLVPVVLLATIALLLLREAPLATTMAATGDDPTDGRVSPRAAQE